MSFLSQKTPSRSCQLHCLENTLADAVVAGDVAFYGTTEAQQHLKGSIQDVLDRYRDSDIAAEVRRRRDAQNRQQQPGSAERVPQHAGRSSASQEHH